MRDRALALADAGVGPGDAGSGVRVTSGTTTCYTAILGILMVGGAYVPVDVDDPDERARTVFSEAECAAVVTDGFTIDVRHRRTPDRQVTRSETPEPSDDCWVIFTSGSTGTPKGVAVSHRSAAAFVDAEARIFCSAEPLRPGDRVLAGLSVAFDASCEEMWLAWRSGACLVPAPRSLVKSGMDLGPWLANRGITVVSTVPTLASLWPAETLANVRLLIFGGEACPPELAARLSDEDREVWNTYGPTEATVVTCAAPLDGSDPVRIGLPLDGWDMAIVDPATGVPVADGATGELIIGGVGLARYLDPAKDAEKYAPMPTLGWERAYRSGDLVVMDPEGLIFVGRADEQVKLGGRRIELGEIDASLQALPGVAGGAAAVKDTPAGMQLLIGYLAPEIPGDDRREDWTALLRQELPPALVPRLVLVDDLPTKTSGKVDRNALPWPLPGEEPADGDRDELPESTRWFADQWEAVLGTVPTLDSDFFDSGGGSLAAAQLVSRLRTRHAGVTVGDVYSVPRFGALVDVASETDDAAPARARRTITRTRYSMQALQTLLGIPVHVLAAMKWAVLALVIVNLAGLAGMEVPTVSWWLIVALFGVFVTPWGRMLISAGAARALLRGVSPGTYPRSGSVHLRLWLAEHVADLASAVSVASAPWVTWYGRLLGNRIGPNVDLHSIPPVTGMLTLAEGASIEPEVDFKGWWVDGDVVHIGPIRVGEYAVVGARSTLLPGSRVGAGAVVEPGSAVNGKLRRGQVYSGSPAMRVRKAQIDFPESPPRRRRTPFLLYAIGSVLHAAIPVLAAVPGLALMFAVSGPEAAVTPLVLLAWSPVLGLTWFATTALLIVLAVRALAIGMKEDVVPVRSFAGYRVWATERIMDMARDLLFPLYAGLLTPVWLRLLGAKVGRDVEVSTVLLVPSMTTIADGAFLADDTMVASYELGNGWMRVGRAKVGKRAFLGNSGMAAAGRRVPKNALVAVLSAAPTKAKKVSSWIWLPTRPTPPLGGRGRLRAHVRAVGSSAPPIRGVWETLRLLSVVAGALVVTGVIGALIGLHTALAQVLAATAAAFVMLLLSGVVMMLAGAVAAGIAVAAKWICVGRIRRSEHPLWSSFIWRSELADTFVELVAAPWFARTAVGTPALVWYLRCLGAQIGHGAWVETYWLPEADLVSLGDNSTVNRGCVVQTHLFHDPGHEPRHRRPRPGRHARTQQRHPARRDDRRRGHGPVPPAS